MKINCKKKFLKDTLLGFIYAATIISAPFAAYAMQTDLPFNADDALRQAIADNNKDNVKIALDLGASVSDGLTCAIGIGITDDAMLDPFVNALDKDALSAIGNHGTALHYAAQKGNIIAAEKLLQKGLEIDIFDGAAQTPLMHAIFYRQIAMVRWLVEHGASIDIKVVIKDIEFTIVKWTEQLAKADRNYNDIFNYLNRFQASQNMNHFQKPVQQPVQKPAQKPVPVQTGSNGSTNNKTDAATQQPKLSPDTSSFIKPVLYGLLGVIAASFLYKFFKSTKVSYKK